MLTLTLRYVILVDMKDIYSTAQVAREAGVNKRTLLRWLYAGEIPEPQKIEVGHDNRVWTESDLNRVKRYKEHNYRKRS
jgi:DNA-binding transcriptional MerR regulator